MILAIVLIAVCLLVTAGACWLVYPSRKRMQELEKWLRMAEQLLENAEAMLEDTEEAKDRLEDAEEHMPSGLYQVHAARSVRLAEYTLVPGTLFLLDDQRVWISGSTGGTAIQGRRSDRLEYALRRAINQGLVTRLANQEQFNNFAAQIQRSFGQIGSSLQALQGPIQQFSLDLSRLWANPIATVQRFPAAEKPAPEAKEEQPEERPTRYDRLVDDDEVV